MEYDLLLEKITNLLSRVNYVVLATASKDGVVTASKMCVISDGTALYFQTDSNFEKARIEYLSTNIIWISFII